MAIGFKCSTGVNRPIKILPFHQINLAVKIELAH